MICPKCGTENVEVSREEKATYGSSFGVVNGKTRPSGKKLYGHGMSSSSSSVHYQTTALCHNCGYSWHPVGEDEEKNKKAAMGCLVVIVIMAIIFISFLAGQSKPAANSGRTDFASGVAAKSVWATEPTPVEDFKIELRNGQLYLQEYEGNDTLLRISSKYVVNGVTYPVSLDELFLSSAKLESVIFEDGITSINESAFNLTNVTKVYFPKSMSPIYDYMLAYINSSLSDIEYEGTEEEWNEAFQHYIVPSVESAADSEDYAGAGAALAGKLNEAIGHEFSMEGKTIHYNVKLEDIIK